MSMALHQDVRYALRTMGRAPVSTAVAVLSLAMGIGATTAVFTLINGLMFRPLPVRDPGSIVELLSRYPGEPQMNVFAWKFYEHYRARNHVFSELIGSARMKAALELLSRYFEYIIVDGPPLMPVTDAAVISSLVTPRLRRWLTSPVQPAGAWPGRKRTSSVRSWPNRSAKYWCPQEGGNWLRK